MHTTPLFNLSAAAVFHCDSVACIIWCTHILYNGFFRMCNVLCMCVMKHVGQDELRMSLQFTLQLCDSLQISSGWLNTALLLLGLSHRDLLQYVSCISYQKKNIILRNEHMSFDCFLCHYILYKMTKVIYDYAWVQRPIYVHWHVT